MNPPSNISVALCAYNGSQFLLEQLQSIATQTLLPDEIVIFDDCSTDDTPALAKRFAETAAFPVRVHVNPCNRGIRENFAACIAACNGATIVLSDQDDVWLPNKLERLSQVLGRYPDAAFAFSDAWLVDQSLQPLPQTLWESNQFGAAEWRQFRNRRGFEILMKRHIVTGATLAFRKEYRDALLPIPNGWIHDEWIALILSAISWGVPVEETLIKYRQHPQQQIGERRRSVYQQYLIARNKTPADFRRVALALEAAKKRLEEYAPEAHAAVAAVRQKALHAERRTRIHEPGTWRWPLVVGEWWAGNYGRFSPGWKALAQDLFL